MDNKEIMLTTKDNPYSPFKEFEQWLNYDTNVKKYGTCSYLARICDVIRERNPLLTEDEITDEAIKTIISNDYENIYKIATE